MPRMRRQRGPHQRRVLRPLRLLYVFLDTLNSSAIYGLRDWRKKLTLITKGNTIFEPGKEGSGYKGSGSGSGDKEEGKEGEKEGK